MWSGRIRSRFSAHVAWLRSEDGHPFKSSFMAMRHAKHMLPVKVEIRRTIGKEVGETVRVVLERRIRTSTKTAHSHPDKRANFCAWTESHLIGIDYEPTNPRLYLSRDSLGPDLSFPDKKIKLRSPTHRPELCSLDKKRQPRLGLELSKSRHVRHSASRLTHFRLFGCAS